MSESASMIRVSNVRQSSPLEDETALRDKLSRLETALDSVLRGKPDVVRYTLITTLAGGHLLLEDVPGVGKTTLALALATFLGCSFSRIQFTSDLLPSDILGVSIFNQQSSRFEFRPGPIFSNIVLADELNRSTPKTQSCLLEAMNDGKVSIDGLTRMLPEPFLVIATQNPIEHHGTFPLPESQLDRFMVRIRIGYPDREAERGILRGIPRPVPDETEAVLSPEELIELQDAVRRVRVVRELEDYMLRIVSATRNSSRIALGVSPRGAQHLFQIAQAAAFMDFRNYVIPDDIKRLAIPVFSHRVIPVGPGGLMMPAGEAEALMSEIIEQVPVPD